MRESFLRGIVAGSSLVLGGLLALRFPIGRRPLGLIMAFGAGVLISAVAFELVHEAFETSAATAGSRSASSPDPVSSSSETRSSTALAALISALD